MFLFLVLVIILLKEIEQRLLRSGSIIRKKEGYSLEAIFLMRYLSIRTILTEKGIILRTRVYLGDLRLNN
jgi:hypothetical protein